MEGGGAKNSHQIGRPPARRQGAVRIRGSGAGQDGVELTDGDGIFAPYGHVRDRVAARIMSPQSYERPLSGSVTDNVVPTCGADSITMRAPISSALS